MGAVGKNIVWLASFPKSGNTWVRILLSNIMARSEAAQDVNRLFLKSAIAGCRERFEDVTLVDSHLLRPEEMEALRPAMHDGYSKGLARDEYVKTHDAYTYLADGSPLLGRSGRGRSTCCAIRVTWQFRYLISGRRPSMRRLDA